MIELSTFTADLVLHLVRNDLGLSCEHLHASPEDCFPMRLLF